MFDEMVKRINKLKDPEKARVYRRFFKSGKGEYGEGDRFLGLNVPQQREIAKEFVSMGFGGVKKLLDSEFHEYRLMGFFILVYKSEKALDDSERKEIVDFYLENIDKANNWDLIDCVCDKLLGRWLVDKDKRVLYEFARSDSMWKRRIAIITTFEFIKWDKFDDTIKISGILLNDKEDLIHKAVGWMLREVGKRDVNLLRDFLKRYSWEMPRTMLRYAIEKFDKVERERWMER
tara:strand:+ start:390 stop:1088 length:699 start_codon:yes stop_codon:yes gene_type:complete